jgi:hypothetical protein
MCRTDITPLKVLQLYQVTARLANKQIHLFSNVITSDSVTNIIVLKIPDVFTQFGRIVLLIIIKRSFVIGVSSFEFIFC